jgi:uncharacterized membrane protein
MSDVTPPTGGRSEDEPQGGAQPPGGGQPPGGLPPHGEAQPPAAPPPPSPEPPPPPDAGQPAPQASGDGLDPKVAGLLSYLLFGWIGGLIMYFTQTHPEVRFHAAQSILASIAIFAIYFVLGIISGIAAVGLGALAFFGLLYTVLGLAVLALWVFLCIKGYNLEHFKLPFIGDIAENWAAK